MTQRQAKKLLRKAGAVRRSDHPRMTRALRLCHRAWQRHVEGRFFRWGSSRNLTRRERIAVEARSPF